MRNVTNPATVVEMEGVRDGMEFVGQKVVLLDLCRMQTSPVFQVKHDRCPFVCCFQGVRFSHLTAHLAAAENASNCVFLLKRTGKYIFLSMSYSLKLGPQMQTVFIWQAFSVTTTTTTTTTTTPGRTEPGPDQAESPGTSTGLIVGVYVPLPVLLIVAVIVGVLGFICLRWILHFCCRFESTSKNIESFSTDIVSK